MKITSVLSFAFAALATASPIDLGNTLSGKSGKEASKQEGNFNRGGNQQLATFDDLPSVPALPEVNPVGVYKGLKYKSFNVLEQGVAGVITTGIRPQSGLNVAANGITDSVLNGGPALIAKSPTKSFDLESLYLACVVNSVESVAGVPQQCTIAFTAYKKGSQGTPFQTVNKQFDPTNAVLSDMRKASFPKSWTGLERVEVAAVQATSTEPLNALLIDDVKYVLNK